MYFLIFLKKLEWFFIRLLRLKKFHHIWKWSQIEYGIFSDTPNIEIGEYVYIWEGARFHGYGWISIWSGTIVWPNVTIRSSNHDYKTHTALPYGFWIEARKVSIGENCWIGEWVSIVPGTVIGEWVIVWMWSVVSGNIPNFALVVWNPGIIKKYRDAEAYQKLKSEWKIYLQLKQEKNGKRT